jgi:hypothetical protein
MSNHYLSWIGPAGLGASLMYLLDPSAGRRRRALLRDQVAHAAHAGNDWCAKSSRDFMNRVEGMRARWQREDDEAVDDTTIEARVRAALGRVTTHAGAIGVESRGGIVELVGPVLAREHRSVVHTVARVRGVADLIDHLAVHEDADSVPGLQGEGSIPASNWSRPARLASIAGGAALIAYGVQQRTLVGGIAAAVGAGLVARSLSPLELPARIAEMFNALEDGRQPDFDMAAGQRGLLGS